MARNVVLFIRDHVVEHPATTLESTLVRLVPCTSCTDASCMLCDDNGLVQQADATSKVADIPVSVTRYKLGQRVVFSRKKDALAFVKAMTGAAIAHE